VGFLFAVQVELGNEKTLPRIGSGGVGVAEPVLNPNWLPFYVMCTVLWLVLPVDV